MEQDLATESPRPAEAVANWFIDRAAAEGRSLDPMMLQKLVYFAHGWRLALAGSPLIDELFEAWEYGPILPSLYHEFKDHGTRPIRARAERMDWRTFASGTPLLSASDPAIGLLETIWAEYGRLTNLQLSHMAHLPDSPWEQTRRANPGIRNANIPNSLIKADFERRYDDYAQRAA